LSYTFFFQLLNTPLAVSLISFLVFYLTAFLSDLKLSL